MKVFIITGTSRGLGEAIALKMMVGEHMIFCLSRSENQALNETSELLGQHLVHISCDLRDPVAITSAMGQVFEALKGVRVSALNLINNAAVVTPVKHIERCSPDEIAESFQVNILAPMILTSQLIALSAEMKCKKKVLNISSGAANKAYDGWSCYCSTKAALDMFTRCVAKEQEAVTQPVMIMSFDPGIMDTAMQQDIRNATVEDFSQIDRFVTYKEQQQLVATEQVAHKIWDLFMNDQFVQGDIRG